jgi:hypothetical protein
MNTANKCHTSSTLTVIRTASEGRPFVRRAGAGDPSRWGCGLGRIFVIVGTWAAAMR